ncbi:MAG: hypothetical protein ACI4TH_10180 [Candidatus Ornithomonoglobus sp.]
MKKEYRSPALNLVLFAKKNVITASGPEPSAMKSAMIEKYGLEQRQVEIQKILDF